MSAVRLVAGGGDGGLSRVLKVEKSFQVSVVLLLIMNLVMNLMHLINVERFFASVTLDANNDSSAWSLARSAGSFDLCHFLSAVLRLVRNARRVSLSQG